MIHAFIKKGCFQDSVSLMLISRKLSETEGVEDVSVMMGTPANKSLLEATGFWHEDFSAATPNDICVAIHSQNEDQTIVQLICQQLDSALEGVGQANGAGQKLVQARRWESACQKLPQANLTLISIAGEYAAELADQSLESGKNVMIFSDNVSLEEEVALKTKARQKGLVVMGPDCGTTIIAGTPLAFANVMAEGNIGVIGASGTGIQELISQIALNGQGISHALGLGGRDLSAHIGGISALTALEMLSADPQSQVLAFVSKPPAESVRKAVIAAMHAQSKPVVALFLGHKSAQKRDGNIWFAETLDEAARLACLLANVESQRILAPNVAGSKIVGLYTGGTLAAEAAMLLAEQLGVEADDKHHHGTMLDAEGHRVVDLGDDFYTVGKPHPMIDPTTRNQMIKDLATRDDTGVLLLDVVIGYGAQADPAGTLASAIAALREKRSAPLAIIATVTGTEQDPQCRSQQRAVLREAGVIVMDTLPEATLLASKVIRSPSQFSQQKTHPLLEGVAVINAGLRSFAQDLQATATPVVHFQWAPVAGGNPKLARLLALLK